jgi:hypothetical protein
LWKQICVLTILISKILLGPCYNLNNPIFSKESRLILLTTFTWLNVILFLFMTVIVYTLSESISYGGIPARVLLRT